MSYRMQTMEKEIVAGFQLPQRLNHFVVCVMTAAGGLDW